MRIARMFALMVVAATAFALEGCGGGDGGGGDTPGGGEGGSGGGTNDTVASLALLVSPAVTSLPATCTQSDNGCLCPKGASATLTLSAKNAKGKSLPVDAQDLTWESSGASASVADNGDGTAAITGDGDWFDNGGSEGAATVTATYAGLTASMPVTVVLNASGNWHTSAGTRFETDLTLAQSGRTLRDAVSGYTGAVNGNRLTLNISLLSVDARFSSRDEVSGTFSGPNGLSGSATCTRK